MARRVFEEARREVAGFSAAVERRALAFLAARVPAWVQSDHMTALGFLGTIGAGVAYSLHPRAPACLHLVNLCLVLNWLGDSLDGTLARYRRCERPRYGFYVDHVIDAIGAVFVIGGLGLSGLMSPGIAAVLLAAYYLTAIHVYLATYTAGTFKISAGPIGGTELRLLLVAANLAALQWPAFVLGGTTVRLFDVLGTAAALALAGVLLVWIPRLSAELRRRDTPGPTAARP